MGKKISWKIITDAQYCTQRLPFESFIIDDLQVRRSQKFGKILELILLMGNIMNTGSRNEQSLGFDISYLPKLSNTKDRDNKSTLLHFLVETIEKSHPKLLNFYVSVNDTGNRIFKIAHAENRMQYLSYKSHHFTHFRRS